MGEEWAPVGIDPTTPSVARMYDFYRVPRCAT